MSRVYTHVILSPPLRIYEPHPYPGEDPLTKYSQPLPGPQENSASPPIELTYPLDPPTDTPVAHKAS